MLVCVYCGFYSNATLVRLKQCRSTYNRKIGAQAGVKPPNALNIGVPMLLKISILKKGLETASSESWNVCGMVASNRTTTVPITPTLDGRNRARVNVESLARVIAAIRITSVRWWSYHPLKTQNLVLLDSAIIVLRFESCNWRSLV